MRTKLYCVVLPALIVVAGLLMIHGTAQAATGIPIPSNTLPESNDFTQVNNVWLTVANSDGVKFLLDARTSVVRIYSPNRTVKLTITNGGQCVGSGPDQGATEAQAHTRFEFHSLNYNPSGYSAVSAPYVDLGSGTAGQRDKYSYQMNCGAFPITLTNSATAVPATEGGYKQHGQYAFEIRAIWQNAGMGGWNQFKYQVDNASNARLSYYAGSGDKFALKADDAQPFPGGSGNFSMGFAPNCLLDSGDTKTVRVYWSDADAGQANQGGVSPVRTQFFEYDSTGQTSYAVPINNVRNSSRGGSGGSAPGGGVLDINTGNDDSGYADITIRGHFKYKWVWYNIRTANGIQFQLPTDSFNTMFNFDTECAATVANASCSLSSRNPNPNVGDGTFIKAKVTNTSGPGGPSFDTSYELRQVAPGGGVRNLTRTLDPGQTDPNLSPYTIAARGSPTTVSFTYQLFDGSGAGAKAVGSSCSIDITWGAVAAGNLQVACDQTIVSGVNINDNWHPPAGALPKIPPRVPAPQRVTSVPAQIIITDTASGDTSTYTVPGGVPNDGSPRYINTFAMWGAMWAHRSYSLQLVVQGDATSRDSVSYDNNGKWLNPATGTTYYPAANLGSVQTVGNCLDAYCGGGVIPDAEPGQTKTLTYVIHMVNNTLKPFSPNDNSGGYYFVVNTSGGLANVGGPTASPDIVPGDPTDVSVNFSARIDYTGDFGITLYFQGSPLSLTQLPGGSCPPAPVTPASRAFFEVRGSDISTGGGFGSPVDGSCSTTAPGYIAPQTGYSAVSGPYNYAGGIRSYANPNAGKGSVSEFGALSLGLTLGTPNGPTGFFSRNNAMFAGGYALPAALTSGNLGGYLNSTGVSRAHCVNDFFIKERKDPSPPATSGNLATDISNCPLDATTGSYRCEYLSNGDMTISAATVPRTRQITLYVDGNVTITGNINYAGTFDPSNPYDVPYLAIIVRGNITLTSGVSRLDGLYVTQPSPTSPGIFSTCDDFCPGQLIVNGAVIAQQVALNRVHGTMGPIDADVNNITDFPAEIFNYVPSMVIGFPNFNPTGTSLEALFSLPPVF